MAVSSIPVLIDLDKFGSSGSFYGPYQSGSALYVVIGESVAGGIEANVFKSVDSGATWVSQDTGNRPTIANNGNFSIVFTPALVHIIAAYLGAPNLLVNSWFSLSTDLFLTPVSVTISHDLVAEQIAVLRGDGSVFVQYVISDTSIEALYFNVFSSGSWGTETLLTQGVGGENLNGIAAVVDSSDTAHFLWVLTALSVDTVKYQTIDFGGTVSSSVNFPIANFDLGLKPAIVWSGVLVFPYVDLISFQARTAFATGATTNPSSASWTSAADWVGTLPPDSTNNSTAFPLVNGSGDLEVYFVNLCASLGTQIYSVRWNGGAFDAPVLFYDPQVYPPPGTTPAVSLFLISLALNSGATQIVFGASGGVAGTFFANGGGAITSGYRNRVY